MDIFVQLTIIFGITTLVLASLLWIARMFMIRLYGSVRNWFLRPRGYGFAYFYMPNKRLKRHFCNLQEDKIHFKNGVYSNIPEYQFDDFENNTAILFNYGDANPINPYEKQGTGLQHNPKFWDKFAKLIRLYYQTQTNESLIFMIVIGIAVLMLVLLAVSGYTLYELNEMSTVLEGMKGVVDI